MDENSHSEITFKAKYKLPNIEEIPRASSGFLPTPTYRKLIGLNSRAPTLLSSSGEASHPYVCLVVGNGNRTGVFLIFGPVPKLKDVQTTLTLGEREPIRSTQLTPSDITPAVKRYYGFCYRLDMDDLKRYAERAIFEVTAILDAANQMAIIPRAEVEKSRCLNKELASLLSADTFSDVSFKVGGEEIKAHKAILSARSEYFSRMFSSGMKECQSNKVDVEDSTPAHFKLFLKAVYGGFSSLENVKLDSVIGIIGLADKYQLSGVNESCLDFIRERAHSTNVAKILLAASKLNNEELRLIAFPVLKVMNEKDRWKILHDLGDDELIEKFLASL